MIRALRISLGILLGAIAVAICLLYAAGIFTGNIEWTQRGLGMTMVLFAVAILCAGAQFIPDKRR